LLEEKGNEISPEVSARQLEEPDHLKRMVTGKGFWGFTVLFENKKRSV
jgi:hypothetical protein